MKWLMYIFPLFLVACSTLPKTIQDPPRHDIQLETVAGQVSSYLNKPVRWGGKIITVNNDDQQSLLQIVQFPLNGFGKPIVTKASQGRFVIQTKQFLDPEVYKPDRLATFSGVIHSEQQRLIDQKTLLLPVIQMTESHLWAEQPSVKPYYEGYYFYPHPHYDFYGRRYFLPH
jgi:outer membrane lipoprotein